MASASHPTVALRQSERIAAGRLWLSGLIAALLAAIAGIAIRALGVAAGAIPADYTLLQPARVIAVCVLAALAATVLLALLARWMRHPVATFRIVAAVFLVISLAGPLGTGAAGATIATMLVMHIVTATIVVGVLTIPGLPRPTRHAATMG